MRWKECKNGQNGWRFGLMPIVEMSFLPFLWLMAMVVEMSVLPPLVGDQAGMRQPSPLALVMGFKISDIYVDIFFIYPISVMLYTILVMIDISWKCQVCDTYAP